jgi:acyl transferase domain-containing protein
VGSVADVVAALRVLSAAAGTVAGLVRGEAPRKERPLLAFTCAPEGAERAGMGRWLFDTLPLFREAIERCGEALRPHLQTPLAELLYGDGRREARITRAQEGHPALFAVEAALCEVWRSFGIVPGLLHGRGVGEYVSAWASGILTLEDAVLLVFERALALEATGKGAPDSSSFGRRIRGMVLRPPRLEIAPAARGASAADMARPDYWIHGLAASASSASSGSSELPLPGAGLSLEIGPAGSDWPCLLSSLGLLYTRGLDVDWKGLHPVRRPQRLALPTYPFQRQRFWMDVADTADPPPRA